MNVCDLAVVIVNWNVRDLLVGCLGSLHAALDAAEVLADIWVVDNASIDNSVDLLNEWFSGVHLISSPTNLGFAGGNNLALRAMGFDSVQTVEQEDISENKEQTRPRYVLFLNPDTLVRESAIKHLLTFMERTPRAGVCGPRLTFGDGSFQHAAYRFPSLAQLVLDFWPINWRLTESAMNGRYSRDLYEDLFPFAIDHPLGAAMLFRGEVIQQTGGFDLEYRMYVEEIDWCMRVKRVEWEIHCVPKAEVVHFGGQSARQVRPQMITALWRSRYILFKKHYSDFFCWLARRIIRMGMRRNIFRTWRELREGKIEGVTAEVLIGAYREVMRM